MGGLLTPLRLLSFWKIKARALAFGESGGFTLLTALRTALKPGQDVRFHLMGHRFGCIVVSAMVAGPGVPGTLARPVNSLVLVQGAMSLWSYCAEIPRARGRSGYFRGIVAERSVHGPIVTTRTQFDHAVGLFYPLGASPRRQVAYAPGNLPKYGAVGSFGLRGPGVDGEDKDMLSVDMPYQFQPGTVYNLECSAYIRRRRGVSGAHGDFLHPEVAHAVWEAAMT